MKFDFWQLIGGVGLFLFAMSQLEAALKAFAGRAFKRLLQRSTDRPLEALATGTLSTAVLQSSSLLGLMVLAFVGAGLMSLDSALGVIFGANLGTTFTGWLVTLFGFKLDIGTAALPLVGVGGLVLVSTRGRLAEAGRFVAALGFLLMGLGFMKESVATFGEQIDITRLAGLHLWQFLLFGLAVTAIIQSSSATMMLALTALYSEVIALPAAAAIAIGADLGTTTTVMLGALPGPPAKKRVALAHVIFNLTTDLLAFALLLPLLAFISLVGIADPLLALVAFHSLFNLIGILIFLPFIRPFARFLEGRFITETQRESRYIVQAALEVPEAAVRAIEEETAHLIARVVAQNRHAFSPPLPTPPGDLPLPFSGSVTVGETAFDDLYRNTKRLEGEILAFAVRLQGQPLEETESSRLQQLLTAVRYAVHSAKSLRDIRHNLIEFEDSPQSEVNQFLEHVRSVMTAFYGKLHALPGRSHTHASFRDFAQLIEQVHAWHDQLHLDALAGIGSQRIAESDISSLLNVNREVLNSNIALVMALKEFHLAPAESEALRQLPGTA